MICQTGGLGWLIIIGLSAAFGVYAVGGAAYSRSTEPKKGVTHPHADAWSKLPGLISDGWFYTRVKAAENGLAFLAPVGSEYKSVDMESKKASAKTDRASDKHAERSLLRSEKKEKKGEKKERKEKKEKKEKKRKPKPKASGDALLSSP